jgi:hypothetical protein
VIAAGEKGLGRAWLMLATVFALHVADEAAHDFLAWWNPIAMSLRPYSSPPCLLRLLPTPMPGAHGCDPSRTVGVVSIRRTALLILSYRCMQATLFREYCRRRCFSEVRCGSCGRLDVQRALSSNNALERARGQLLR